MFRFILIFFLIVSNVLAQDITALGGSMTSNLEGRHSLQVTAPNVNDNEKRTKQLEGFGVFHGSFTELNGLVPTFVNYSCGGCHVNNGRGPVKFSKSDLGSTAIVKVSLEGEDSDGSPKDVPGVVVGEQLHDHSILDNDKTLVPVKLKWETIKGTYKDKTPFVLRKPLITFSVKGINQRKIQSSMRMTPMVFGPGLIDAIPESDILALSDPFDFNRDGISGSPNFVPDVSNGGTSVGRFGFKGTQPNLAQQSAAAFFNDMGIANKLFNGGQPSEISDEDFDSLVVYQALGGVPPARNQDDPAVISGKKFFQNIGCDSCHKMTFVTKSSEPALDNQAIHPFSDFLLHDMGKGLDDGRPAFFAESSEWKTTPLWGLGFSMDLPEDGSKLSFLHDGRAKSLEEAILWHNGEGKRAKDKFVKMAKADRDNLVAFLRSL